MQKNMETAIMAYVGLSRAYCRRTLGFRGLKVPGPNRYVNNGLYGY